MKRNYKLPLMAKSSIKSIVKLEGETIEDKIMRIMNNKEPIKDGAPAIYTERKDGIIAAYNIRTDRFEVATDAMDKVNKSRIASRDYAPKLDVIKNETDAEGESIHATE